MSPTMGAQATIEVVGFFSLRPLLGPEGRRRLAVPPEGTSVTAVLAELDLSGTALGLMMVNGCSAFGETRVHPGDRLALFPDYVPYHKIYGTCVV